MAVDADGADEGRAAGQFNLGVLYMNGSGVAQDDAAALKWYVLAAKQNHAGAMYNLGWMYENGRGVPASVEEATNWYRMAAKLGDEDAKKRLRMLGKD